MNMFLPLFYCRPGRAALFMCPRYYMQLALCVIVCILFHYGARSTSYITGSGLTVEIDYWSVWCQ